MPLFDRRSKSNWLLPVGIHRCLLKATMWFFCWGQVGSPEVLLGWPILCWYCLQVGCWRALLLHSLHLQLGQAVIKKVIVWSFVLNISLISLSLSDRDCVVKDCALICLLFAEMKDPLPCLSPADQLTQSQSVLGEKATRELYDGLIQLGGERLLHGASRWDWYYLQQTGLSIEERLD